MTPILLASICLSPPPKPAGHWKAISVTYTAPKEDGDQDTPANCSLDLKVNHRGTLHKLVPLNGSWNLKGDRLLFSADETKSKDFSLKFDPFPMTLSKDGTHLTMKSGNETIVFKKI